MTSISLAVWITLASAGAPDAAPTPQDTRGVFLTRTAKPHSASLLQEASLDASWRPSESSPLRLTDGLRLASSETPAPLDQGGGLSSDLRQILALILGFIPGFGIGHLIARDRDGFILFLIIDVALYVLWGTIGYFVWKPFGFVGSAIWLVVHIIQALDAYAEAGGERIVGLMRERALEIATRATTLREPLRPTSKIFQFSF